MYVGVFKRFFAILLDLVVIMGFYLSILFIVQFTSIISKENALFNILASIVKRPFDNLSNNLNYLAAYYLFGAIIWFIYEALFVCSHFSGTPGKIVLGMEIACYNNSSVFKAFIRSFIKIISIVSVVGMIIESAVISNHRNSQSLHDIASFTLVRSKVLKGVVESKNIEMIFSDLEEGKLNSFEDVMDLKSRISYNKEDVRENHGLAAAWFLIILTFLASVSLISCHFFGIASL